MEFTISAVLALTGAFVAWTASTAAFAWWLSSRFTTLGENFSKALAENRENTNQKFNDMNLRLVKIELLYTLGKVVPPVPMMTVAGHDETADH